MASTESLERDQQRLAEQVAHLRTEFQEAIACYSIRVQGILTELGDALLAADAAALSSSGRVARQRVIDGALERIASLKLKPAKGRRRDLKAIQQLAEELGDQVAEW